MARKTRSTKPRPQSTPCVCSACGFEAVAQQGKPHRKCKHRTPVTQTTYVSDNRGTKTQKVLTLGGGPLGVWQ